MLPGRLISRTVRRFGVVHPALIHNGGYYFVNLQIYEDGLVNCWGMLDLPLFREKLGTGWVVCGVPDGDNISVHDLGSWPVTEGAWELTPAGLYERVRALVAELNPTMENLHDCHGRTTRQVGPVRCTILDNPTERPTRNVGAYAWAFEPVHGSKASIFVRQGELFLADVRVFADGVVELAQLPQLETTTIEGLRQLLDEGRALCAPPPGSRVRIMGLGAFTAGVARHTVSADDFLGVVADLVEELNGRPSTIARCRQALEAYKAQPGAANLSLLRLAYEAIPTHHRMYVGDMDSKDSEVRAILAGRAGRPTG